MARSISSSSEELAHQAELATSLTSSIWAKVAVPEALALPLLELELGVEVDEELVEADWDDDALLVEFAESHFFLGEGQAGDQWPVPPQLWHLEVSVDEEE